MSIEGGRLESPVRRSGLPALCLIEPGPIPGVPAHPGIAAAGAVIVAGGMIAGLLRCRPAPMPGFPCREVRKPWRWDTPRGVVPAAAH